MLVWRARQRLASADREGALAVAAELAAARIPADPLESVLERVLAARAP